MTRLKQPQIILLLTDGFDEAAVGMTVAILREASLAVTLVGLRMTQIRGEHGMMVSPMLSLDQLLASAPPLLALIFPGDTRYLARFTHDPRVNELVERVIKSQGVFVGFKDITVATFVTLTDTTNLKDLIKIQGEADLETFINQLGQELLAQRV
ncbi:MAG: DJ-1/PfpI family protein [Chloroflexota bacterium]